MKTVVFCRSVDDCVSLYEVFDFNMQDGGYFPKGVKDVMNGMFGMFHAQVTALKGALLESQIQMEFVVCHLGLWNGHQHSQHIQDYS